MSPHNNNDEVLSELRSIETKACQNNHRYLVVFSGDDDLVKSALAGLMTQLNTKDTLVVTTDSAWQVGLKLPGQVIKANQLKTYLGSDVERLIWDGFSGLHPDGLGAAAGLIKGGGLLFLLVPDVKTLANTPDPDYLRMCAAPEALALCGTRFLQRLVSLIESDAEVRVLTQDSLSRLARLCDRPDAMPHPIPASAEAKPCLPTADQIATIEAIISVAKGHRKRPLVIQADRGRGKSSALGLAAARVCREHQLEVIITAPSPLACEAAFRHFEAESDRQRLEKTKPKQPATLRFLAPDQLLATKPKCHLLLVDEAAAIPAPLLAQLLANFPRIVFSSTVHGYEGTGQGFAVRFRKTLDSQTPQWKSIQLSQPVRWLDHDPLERWIGDLLLLNAEIAEPPELAESELQALPVKWISQSELASQTALLQQVIGLLVLAHYQTSPSDIRLILDHPAIHLGMIEIDRKVLAVVLLIHEGGVDELEVAQAIIEGRRRPRGHLIPQTLTASTGIASLLKRQTFRVMRIAVHPSRVNLGLGSKLIQASEQLARQHDLDYLSASFGFMPELMAFWSKNRCQLLRIGYHKDAASGMQSAIVARPISSVMTEQLRQCRGAFRQHFVQGLSRVYRTLEWQVVHEVLLALELDPWQASSLDQIQIDAYAQHKRSLEDSTLALSSMVLNNYSKRLVARLSPKQQQLIIIKLLQGHSWKTSVNALDYSGKKQAEQALRTAIASLCDIGQGEKSMNYQEALTYLLSKPEAVEDYPFGPEVMVPKVKDKMFATLGYLDGQPKMNLKCDPDHAFELRDLFESVTPGYHMNKKHWNTVLLDGSIPNGEIERMIDHSYALVVKKLKKTERQALELRYGKDSLYRE